MPDAAADAIQKRRVDVDSPRRRTQLVLDRIARTRFIDAGCRYVICHDRREPRKTVEPIEMPFDGHTRVAHAYRRNATWRIRLNEWCSAAMPSVATITVAACHLHAAKYVSLYSPPPVGVTSIAVSVSYVCLHVHEHISKSRRV